MSQGKSCPPSQEAQCSLGWRVLRQPVPAPALAVDSCSCPSFHLPDSPHKPDPCSLFLRFCPQHTGGHPHNLRTRRGCPPNPKLLSAELYHMLARSTGRPRTSQGPSPVPKGCVCNETPYKCSRWQTLVSWPMSEPWVPFGPSSIRRSPGLAQFSETVLPNPDCTRESRGDLENIQLNYSLWTRARALIFHIFLFNEGIKHV